MSVARVAAAVLTVTFVCAAPADAKPKRLPLSNDFSAPPQLRAKSKTAKRSALRAKRLSDPITGAGFLTYGSQYDYSEPRARRNLTLRLVSGSEGNVETLRTAAANVAASAAAQGLTITVAAGTVADTSPDRQAVAGEILLSVDSTSPCTGSWAGCGGPRLPEYRRGDRAGVWSAGRIWVHPIVLGYSAADREHVIAHELGHALGLQHFDAAFNGVNQVMHSSSYAASGFQTGDRNGLAFLAQLPPASWQRSPSGDGYADLVVANPSTATFAVATSTGAALGGAGTGHWLSGWGANPDWARIGDVNGDGKGDLVAADKANNRFVVATSTGSAFGGPGTGTWLSGWAAALQWAELGDFDGDGKDDIVFNSPSQGAIMVARSYGTGFSAPQAWQTSWGGGKPQWGDTGDFNGDGKDDVILSNASNNTYAVTTSTGSAFGGPGTQTWLTGWTGSPAWARAGDFNGDRRDDLIVQDPATATYRVATSTGSALSGAGTWLSGWGYNAQADVGDFNGDGKDDLISPGSSSNYAVAPSSGTALNAPGGGTWLTGWSTTLPWVAAG
ncbi:MAG: VCBS repeat-containing protein [Solirubrobacteraceae bacterium]|nr:VCBS repeat-containing protein [Solirubrobacteraceae bacterium]